MTAPPVDTEALRRLADAATPGPWRFYDSTDTRGSKGEFRAPSPHNGFMLIGPWTNDADLELMLAARTAVPALLDENAALRARIRAVRELHQHGGSTFGDGLEDHTPVCADCLEEWPCPTIRALDGTVTPPRA